MRGFRIGCCTALSILLAAQILAGAAGGDCCQYCGCTTGLTKVCRPVPEMKKVPKTTYSCKCEDFCMPGPSERCGPRTPWFGKACAAVKWQPKCGQPYTRKKLVKETKDVEELKYKWVLETVCASCAEGAPSACTVSQPAELLPATEPAVAPREAQDFPDVSTLPGPPRQ